MFSAHEIFVNLSPSGMYDKTLFEASASGCLVVALSTDFTEGLDSSLVPKDESPRSIADALSYALDLSAEKKASIKRRLRARAEENSLPILTEHLVREMSV